MGIDQILLLLLFLWCLGTVLVLFRRELSMVWKISAVLVFGLYALWYYPDWSAAYQRLIGAPEIEILVVLTAILDILPVVLLIVWPFVIFHVFQSTPGQAQNTLRNMILLTLFYWVLWFVCYSAGFTPSDALRHYLPESLELPAIPEPPRT